MEMDRTIPPTPRASRIPRRSLLALAGATSIGALLAACSSPAPSPTAAPAKPATQSTTAPAKPTAAAASKPAAAATMAPTVASVQKATLRLDWLVGGQHAPFYVAREKGYYKEAGIDLEIGEGKGSTQVIQLIGAKNDTFGFADGGSVVVGLAQDVPIKEVAGIIRKTPLGFASLKATGIKTPKDLEGRTYGAVPGSASHKLWPIFTEINKIDASKVRIVNIDNASADRLILSGQIDFTDSQAGAEENRYTAAGKEGTFLSFADSGLNVVGHGIVTNVDTIKEKPALVKAFVTASVKGWDDTKASPQTAIDLLVKAVPDMQEARKQQALSALQGVLGLLESPNTKGKPLGWNSEADWASTVEAMKKSDAIKKDVDPKTAFTNEFVPGG